MQSWKLFVAAVSIGEKPLLSMTLLMKTVLPMLLTMAPNDAVFALMSVVLSPDDSVGIQWTTDNIISLFGTLVRCDAASVLIPLAVLRFTPVVTVEWAERLRFLARIATHQPNNLLKLWPMFHAAGVAGVVPVQCLQAGLRWPVELDVQPLADSSSLTGLLNLASFHDELSILLVDPVMEAIASGYFPRVFGMWGTAIVALAHAGLDAIALERVVTGLIVPLVAQMWLLLPPFLSEPALFAIAPLSDPNEFSILIAPRVAFWLAICPAVNDVVHTSAATETLHTFATRIWHQVLQQSAGQPAIALRLAW
jgi:hypothetical protein